MAQGALSSRQHYLLKISLYIGASHWEAVPPLFARSGFSSIIPTVADTTGDMFLNFQFFSNTRTSGLRQNAIMGIPTVDLLAEKLPGAVGAVTSPVRPDYNLSSEDVRNFRSLIPLQNLIGIDHTFRSIEGQLPQRSQKSDANNSLDALLNEE